MCLMGKIPNTKNPNYQIPEKLGNPISGTWILDFYKSLAQRKPVFPLEVSGVLPVRAETR
jgi:hypothetical protein